MDVDANVKTQLRPGEYEVKADAPGSQTYTTAVKIEPGKEWQVPLVFTAQQTCQLQDPTQVVSEPGVFCKLTRNWQFLAIYFKAGCLNVNLIFTKPHGVMWGKFGKKRPQWTINLPDGKGLVQYELD